MAERNGRAREPVHALNHFLLVVKMFLIKVKFSGVRF
jgi:hypothetical protein